VILIAIRISSHGYRLHHLWRTANLEAKSDLFPKFHDTFVDRGKWNRHAAWRKDVHKVEYKVLGIGFLITGLFVIVILLKALTSGRPESALTSPALAANGSLTGVTDALTTLASGMSPRKPISCLLMDRPMSRERSAHDGRRRDRAVRDRAVGEGLLFD
jgi:hypothetical protein